MTSRKCLFAQSGMNQMNVATVYCRRNMTALCHHIFMKCSSARDVPFAFSWYPALRFTPERRRHDNVVGFRLCIIVFSKAVC